MYNYEQLYQFIEIVNKLQNKFKLKEKLCHDLETLNEQINNIQELITLVNIRSLKANFDKVQLFIEGFVVKPSVLVCVEKKNWFIGSSFISSHMAGHGLYYNQSNINLKDGVVMYIRDSINRDTNIIRAVRINVLNLCKQLNKNTNPET